MSEHRIDFVRDLKKVDEETEMETDEPATLEDKFEYLLDILREKEQEIDSLMENLSNFEKTWHNHRHSVDTLYSGKAER